MTSYTSKLLQRGGNTIKYINLFVATFGSAFFSSKEGGVPELLSI